NCQIVGICPKGYVVCHCAAAPPLRPRDERYIKNKSITKDEKKKKTSTIPDKNTCSQSLTG
ncbi:MAG: hypothetical protein KA988_06775, partial [Longilinea sp.]|nr:hypothetical protein [Longilinea sp.]